MDEDGIPKTKEKRIEIAERILSRALALGIPRKDVYIDCLTLTVFCRTGKCRRHTGGDQVCQRRTGIKNGPWRVKYLFDCQTDQSSITIFCRWH